MYAQSHPTLPSITAAIGNGVDKFNSSSLGNGEHHIKQEQDFEHNPSLPPIRTNPINHSNGNIDTSNHSRMSINQLCNDTVDSDYPEEMKAAAAVLENLKTTAVTTLPSIDNISPQPLEPRPHAEQPQLPSSEAGFMLSIVKKTMDVYEQGKANSPFIKYTTEMVESSVSRFSKPVIEQLAIVDQYARGFKNEKIIDNEGTKYDIDNDDVLDNECLKRRVRGSEISRSSSPSFRKPHRTSQSSGSSNSTSYAPYTYPNNNSTISATTSTSYPERSRWQRMVIGTGAAVGAAGAAVSEESMKSLKYCQEWINYATQHIDAQIIVLKEFIVNLTNPSTRTVARTSSTSTLASIKKEVVETLRKVIEVVSKYAGVCLPDQAKRSVRTFILNLPTRWASINHTEHSSSPSPMSSPQLAPANGHPLNQTTDYARRLLSLATESLDMLISVSGIFGETVCRAEAWLERLRAVGMPTSMGANSTVNLQFDNVYGSSNTSSHSSPPGSRSRRTSNSVRPNGHGVRKVSRPTPVHVEDDDSTFNGHDSDSSSESEAEPMRMEMDHAQKRALKKANAKSQSNGALNGIKKRKKGGKKENDNIMDLS